MAKQSDSDALLHCGWRTALVVVGIVALLAASLLWAFPKERKQFAPQCPPAEDGGASLRNCIGTVEADDAPLIIALVGVGVFLIVLAANGRRLTSLKVGGFEAGTEAAKEKASEELKDKGRELEPTEEEKRVVVKEAQPVASAVARTKAGDKEVELFALADVPSGVMADLFQKVGEEGLPLPPTLDAEFVARRPGKGNHPWLIKFRGVSGTYRLSYGGRGKDDATLKVI